MVVVLKENPDREQLANLAEWLESLGLSIHKSEGVHGKCRIKSFHRI